MAKEKPTDPDREARKLAKAEKKAKRSEIDGVHKSKSDKKEKKEKKAAVAASDADVTAKLLNTIEETKPGSVAVKEQNGDVKVKAKTEPLLGALVPFANPLADEKVGKKVLKSVKKGRPSLVQVLRYLLLNQCTRYSHEDKISQARRERSCQVPSQIQYRRRRYRRKW